MAFNSEQKKRTQAGVVIAVLVLAIILLVVVLTGALTPKASSSSTGSAETSTSARAGSSDSSSSTSASASTSSSIDSIDDVDTMYGAAAEQLKSQYEQDTSNPSALLNLANGYFDWGAAAMEYSESDDDAEHVTDLFTQAIAYYDQYLEANPDSKSVEVDRAICVFYSGDTEGAIADLEQFTAEDDSFGPAWANLGMFYENAGETDKAKAAYEKAVETDPDDTYQVKTYAEQRLAALEED